MASTQTSEVRILERIRALLAIADHPNTGEHEREVALNQANSLMRKNAIDEALARAAQTDTDRSKVEAREFSLIPEDGDGDLWPYLRTMLAHVAEMNRCRAVILGHRKVEIFGMTNDVSWTEMLYTTLYFELVNTVNPRWDDRRGYDANVYALKVAGFKWADINDLAVAHGERDARVYEQGWGGNQYATGKLSGILIGAYKREAKRRGDDLLVASSRPEHYRRQFIEAFTNRIARRLAMMKMDAEADNDTIPGAALALRSVAQDVEDALFAAHPNLSPEAAAERAAAEREQRRLREERRQAELDAMTPKQRQEFLEKEERAERRNQKYWDKVYAKQADQYDYTAQRLGAAAADRVNLSRAEKVAHTNNKEINQ